MSWLVTTNVNLFMFWLYYYILDSTDNDGHEASEVFLSCPVLTEAIEQDGTFRFFYWSYCTPKPCTSNKITWWWMAGMSRQGITHFTAKGPYKDRLNLTRNWTLVLSNVQISDSTVYRCTVEREGFTSPRYYLVTLVVNATGKSFLFYLVTLVAIVKTTGKSFLFSWCHLIMSSAKKFGNNNSQKEARLPHPKTLSDNKTFSTLAW